MAPLLSAALAQALPAARRSYDPDSSSGSGHRQHRSAVVPSTSAISAWMHRSISRPSRASRYARSPGMRIWSTSPCRGVALIRAIYAGSATAVFQRNEQIGLEGDEELPDALG